jgi:hypothetical protein
MTQVRKDGTIHYVAHWNVIRWLETLLRSRSRDPRNGAAN